MTFGVPAFRLTAVVAAAVVVVACGCGEQSPSPQSQADAMSQLVSAQENVAAVCVKVGVMELAAERTRVYRCRYDLTLVAGRFATPCYADVDGDLDDITDQAARAGFDCSHVAQVAGQ